MTSFWRMENHWCILPCNINYAHGLDVACMNAQFVRHTVTPRLPEIFVISPKIAEISDDFPEPTSPTTATREPRGTLKLMLQIRHKLALVSWSLWCRVLAVFSRCVHRDVLQIFDKLFCFHRMYTYPDSVGFCFSNQENVAFSRVTTALPENINLSLFYVFWSFCETPILNIIANAYIYLCT